MGTSRAQVVLTPWWVSCRGARRAPTAELSNNIIQKGLAFRFDWSGSVHASGRALRPRNPAPPAFMAEVGLRWWRQMKAVRPRMEDSDANGPNPEFT